SRSRLRSASRSRACASVASAIGSRSHRSPDPCERVGARRSGRPCGMPPPCGARAHQASPVAPLDSAPRRRAVRALKKVSRLHQGMDASAFLGRVSFAREGTLVSRAVVAGVLVTLYVLLEWVSFIHDYKGVPITPWNPGLGFLLAVMVLFGTRHAAVLFVGAMAAEILVLRSSLAWPIILG